MTAGGNFWALPRVKTRGREHWFCVYFYLQTEAPHLLPSRGTSAMGSLFPHMAFFQHTPSESPYTLGKVTYWPWVRQGQHSLTQTASWCSDGWCSPQSLVPGQEVIALTGAGQRPKCRLHDAWPWLCWPWLCWPLPTALPLRSHPQTVNKNIPSLYLQGRKMGITNPDSMKAIILDLLGKT